MARLDKTLTEVRELLAGGEIRGPGDFHCQGVASLEAAGPRDLSFVKNEGYFDAARASRAGALLVPQVIDGCSAHQIVVPDPFLAFGMVLAAVAKEKRAASGRVHGSAFVDAAAQLGDSVTVGPGAIICAGARIGDGAWIYGGAYVGRRSSIGAGSVVHPNAVIMEDVTVGDRVVIHGGAVIGADGYGYIQHQGRQIKVPQVGSVVIEDDVEIGALATVDRATVDATVIRRGAKVGDQAHVAHNCDIGEDVLLLPMVAVSGSSRVGRGAVLAGRSSVSDNVTIGDGAVLGATAVAFEDVAAGARVWGNPARPHDLEMKVQAHLGRLPRLAKEVRALRKAADAAGEDQPGEAG